MMYRVCIGSKTFCFRFALICLSCASLVCAAPDRSELEVVPAKINIEAGGSGAQVLIRGPRADQVGDFSVTLNGRKTSYLLARRGGTAPGRVSVIIQARPDAPRQAEYVLTADGRPVPVRINIVEPGEGSSNQPDAPARDLREVVRESTERQIVVDAEQAPVVRRTVPSPLVVAPNGLGATLVLIGDRLDTITDVRVRKATEPPKYRGRTGKLPFRFADGRLEVDVMAGRNTPVGSEYKIDLLVGRFRALELSFTIDTTAPREPEPQVESSPSEVPVIEIPLEALVPPVEAP